MQFWKYQGTGNDFVILNNMDARVEHTSETAITLCDRHFGIGSDGLIVIEPSVDADFKMVFYNPDGSQSFCGNGSRCAVKFAHDQGIITDLTTRFISTDGEHHALISSQSIELSMHDPVFSSDEFNYDGLPMLASALLNTGSPHLVLFLKEDKRITGKEVREHGARIRYSETFAKEGVNVNFVSIEEQNKISIRTYERGVEDETLSCGTGVTAAGIAYHSLFSKKNGKNTIDVLAQGGQLQVKFEFNNSYSKTQLCGPATMVFSGEI